jgi:hypothetical protein
MRRPLAILAALLLFALSAVTAATAARSDRDRGVRVAEEIVCAPTDAPAKPDDKPSNGNNGGGSGSGGAGSGNPGNGGGNTGDGATTNGNGQANGNAGANGQANGNPGANGNNGADANGNGNANGHGNGNGNNGQGNGNATAACADPPADPAEGAVAGGGKLPLAAAGKTVNVEPTDGVVRVKKPGDNSFQALADSAQLPTGTVLDTREGTLTLTSSTGTGAGQQTAAFTGAKFQVRQERAKAAATELVLRGGDFRGCSRIDHDRRATQIRNGFIAEKRARRARSRRGLWGTGRGRFRTRGRWGSATVRGTVWHVQDRCDGTLTTVKRGVVTVSDFGLNRRVSVRAGESYFSRVRR